MFKLPIHWYVVCLGYNAGHFNEEVNGLNSVKREPGVRAFTAVSKRPGKRPFVVPGLPCHPINIMDAS